MSPDRHLLAGFTLALGLAGCAQPGAGGSHLGVGQVAGLGVGTAAGAVIGDKLGGTTGAVIGGAAGLAGAAWLTSGTSDADLQAAAEAARREERQKIMRQYWYEQTETLQGEARPGPGGGLPLHYPAGTYAGINFGARTATDAALEEPDR
jgi:hypothetical protein